VASKFLEKEREGIKREHMVVGPIFSENLEASGRIEIDLTADDND